MTFKIDQFLETIKKNLPNANVRNVKLTERERTERLELMKEVNRPNWNKKQIGS
jgi:hypothetical protein